MENVLHVRMIHLFVLIMMFFFLLFPHYSNAFRPLNNEDLAENPTSLQDKGEMNGEGHLQPINEKQLDDLSPSLIAPQVNASASRNDDQRISQEFRNSVCFKQCHHINEIHPSDKTARQWILLIEKNGHSIFADIPWQNLEQKETLLNYFLKNSKNLKPGSAGIGVW